MAARSRLGKYRKDNARYRSKIQRLIDLFLKKQVQKESTKVGHQQMKVAKRKEEQRWLRFEEWKKAKK